MSTTLSELTAPPPGAVATGKSDEALLEKYRQWRLQFLDETGQLKPGYRPPPMKASFMEEPAVLERQHIPVPKGPVDVW